MGRAGAWARSGLTDDAELVSWTAAKDVYPEGMIGLSQGF